MAQASQTLVTARALQRRGIYKPSEMTTAYLTIAGHAPNLDEELEALLNQNEGRQRRGTDPHGTWFRGLDGHTDGPGPH